MRKYGYFLIVAGVCITIITCSAAMKKSAEQQCYDAGGVEFEQRGQISFCRLPAIQYKEVN